MAGPVMHPRDAFAQRRRLDRFRAVSPVALGVLALVVWQLAAHLQLISSVFLPAPSAVAQRLWQGISEGALLSYTWVTFSEALLGSVLGALIAFPLGYLVARDRWTAAALQPYIAGSQALPAVALAPLLVIWVGYGRLPVVLLCSLMVFFPILLATVLGMRTLDRDVLDSARLDGATGWRMLRHVEVPMALPSLLTGLRNGFTLSVTGAVVGEFVMGGSGLGMALSVQANSADTTALFGTLVLLAALAIGIYGLLSLLERRLLSDRPTTASRFAPAAAAPRIAQPKENV